jgi:tetratricopeptide (TPR) repeat protein
MRPLKNIQPARLRLIALRLVALGPGARFFLSAVVLLPGVASICSADTIVLKNGRRIVALSVTQEGDKVRYQTAAGELSLPKSIVDHIEAGSSPLPDSLTATAAANLKITPPTMEASAAVEKGAVHDDAIDREYLAKVEGAARTHERGATGVAALALHSAAQFELSRGDTEHALGDEKSALTYAPDDPVILMNVAYLHLRRSEYKLSLEYLEHARSVAPENADVAKLAGWAYYGMNKLDQAVAEWRRALSLGPDIEVQRALAKAQRDKQEEDNYRENESSHFTLRYSGAAEPDLAREMLRALETHFSTIESELNFTPPDPIGVILYTDRAFADITRAPGWVGALNDGRIRVPVQGLKTLTPELSRILEHELTHSFIQQKTLGRAPTWIQEGLAQWMEGKRSGENASALVQVYDDRQALTLGQLEGSWMSMSNDVAGYAYAWALANIECIVHNDGMGDVERILGLIAEGSSTEVAIRETLHDGYDDLTFATVTYLKKTYGR